MLKIPTSQLKPVGISYMVLFDILCHIPAECKYGKNE